MSIHSTEAVISETPSENSFALSGEITVPIQLEKYAKELRVSSILQSLLDEHKAQCKVVQTLKEELEFLEQNPSQYFQGRKMFLYHAYTQTLKEYEGKTEFDVQLDARYAVSDKEIGLVFGHIYQINPHDALNETFALTGADKVNQQAAERVEEWQTLDSLPNGHSVSLMEIGRRVLKGHVGAIDLPVSPAMADTERLVEQAKQLQSEEERLKSNFPAATKVIDPKDESESTHSGSGPENGHESESSGVLVEKPDREESMNTSSPVDLTGTAKTPGKTQLASVKQLVEGEVTGRKMEKCGTTDTGTS